MSSSRNAINFAPYEPPPDARSSNNAAASSSASRIPKSPFASSSSSAAANATSSSSRPKSPWFSVGSHQSGARTSDMNSSTAISSSSASTSYANNAASGGGGNVLWDAESGMGNTYPTASSSSSSNPHNEYETCYGLRIDIEAAAAYFLGPILAILLLIIETKNDYVRFHAWQSLLLGCGLAVLHLLFLWSRFFTWILVLFDLAAYGQLAYRAFLDSDTLQRYYLPRIGELAAQWVEEE